MSLSPFTEKILGAQFPYWLVTRKFLWSEGDTMIFFFFFLVNILLDIKTKTTLEQSIKSGHWHPFLYVLTFGNVPLRRKVLTHVSQNSVPCRWHAKLRYYHPWEHCITTLAAMMRLCRFTGKLRHFSLLKGNSAWHWWVGGLKKMKLQTYAQHAV